jgi:hypothetical protein
VYIYGSLDRRPTEIQRTFGFAWSVGGWLLMPYLEHVGPDEAQRLRDRVATEITTTFASTYAHSVNLTDALTEVALRGYAQPATGQKYLITPHG